MTWQRTIVLVALAAAAVAAFALGSESLATLFGGAAAGGLIPAGGGAK